jgi:hypothetical protein
VICLSPSIEMPGYCLKLDHDLSFHISFSSLFTINQSVDVMYLEPSFNELLFYTTTDMWTFRTARVSCTEFAVCHVHCDLIAVVKCLLSLPCSFVSTDRNTQISLNQFSMFHRAFFNSIIYKHQHMHFFTFGTVLV